MKKEEEILSRITGYSIQELHERLTEPILQPYDCLMAMIEFAEQQTNGVNTSHEQALHKHGVMPSLFAVSTEEGINELFWSKKKAEEKFAIYVKEFPSTLFWVEEVFPS